MWDLRGQHLIPDKAGRGVVRLQRLLSGATSLVQLTLPLSQKADGAAFTVGTSDNEPSALFSSCLPTQINRCFRGGWVGGLPPSTVYARRYRAARLLDGPLDGRGEADEWEPAQVAAEVATEQPKGAGAPMEMSGSPARAELELQVGAQAQIHGLSSRVDLNGSAASLLEWDPSAERWAVCVGTSGETIRVRPANLSPLPSPLALLPTRWFAEDVLGTAHLEIGCMAEHASNGEGVGRVAISQGAHLTLDQGMEDTPLLLETLELLRRQVAAFRAPPPHKLSAAEVDDQLCTHLLSSTVAGESTPLAVLARHTGSAPLVDALLREAPQRLGPAALVATCRPGLSHLARRLLSLRAADGGGRSDLCLSDASLSEAAALMLNTPGTDGDTSAWHTLALDDTVASAAVVDAL